MSKDAKNIGFSRFAVSYLIREASNLLKIYGNPFSFDFKTSMPIMTVNRTRQGYARKRILKLAGHFFLGGRNAATPL